MGDGDGGKMYTWSPNQRPGEPLRSWTEPSREREHNARAMLHFSRAAEALRRLIDGEGLTVDDVVALGRLNSFCVAHWYQPVVELMRDPFVEPEVAEYFGPLVRGRSPEDDGGDSPG